MIWWSPGLWFSSPLKVWLWLTNRVATYTGGFYLWKRYRTRRGFWVRMILFNLASLSVLCFVFLRLRQHH